MPLSDPKLVAAFRRGAGCYLDEYGTRQARERTAHFWLATCIANELPRNCGGHHVIGELHTRKSDLTPYLPDTPASTSLIKGNTGAFGYDICVSRDPDFDARSWQTRRREWLAGGRSEEDFEHTMWALSNMAVIAELKTADSTTTNALSIEKDLLKLLAIAKATRHKKRRPKLFFIAAPGPSGARAEKLLTSIDIASERLVGLWPRGEEPEILLPRAGLRFSLRSGTAAGADRSFSS